MGAVIGNGAMVFVGTETTGMHEVTRLITLAQLKLHAQFLRMKKALRDKVWVILGSGTIVIVVAIVVVVAVLAAFHRSLKTDRLQMALVPNSNLRPMSKGQLMILHSVEQLSVKTENR
jgi:phosphoglycerol transferase MdoB-like AlkP superfamily enzyme